MIPLSTPSSNLPDLNRPRSKVMRFLSSAFVAMALWTVGLAAPILECTRTSCNFLPTQPPSLSLSTLPRRSDSQALRLMGDTTAVSARLKRSAAERAAAFDARLCSTCNLNALEIMSTCPTLLSLGSRSNLSVLLPLELRQPATAKTFLL